MPQLRASFEDPSSPSTGPYSTYYSCSDTLIVIVIAALSCPALHSIILFVASSFISLYRPLVPSTPRKPQCSCSIFFCPNNKPGKGHTAEWVCELTPKS